MSTTEQPGYGNCHALSDQCPVEYTIYGALFNLPAMLFFSILFFLILLAQIYYFVRYRTTSFSIFIFLGCAFQILGSVSRVAMHFNPWNMVTLSLNICCLLWGPTFVAAAISICFKNMVHYAGTQYSNLRPSLIPWVFVGTDILSICIQGVGGIIAAVTSGSSNSGSSLSKVGEGLMIGGVCFQIANMLVTAGIMLSVWRRYQAAKKRGGVASSRYTQDKEMDSAVQKKFTWFATVAAVAFLCVIVRCCYRVAEMAGGWANQIMRNEVAFLVLDATMMAIALLAVTIFHPGRSFPEMRNMNKQSTGDVLAREKSGNESSDSELNVVAGGERSFV
jgi:hypothetical protein